MFDSPRPGQAHVCTPDRIVPSAHTSVRVPRLGGRGAPGVGIARDATAPGNTARACCRDSPWRGSLPNRRKADRESRKGGLSTRPFATDLCPEPQGCVSGRKLKVAERINDRSERRSGLLHGHPVAESPRETQRPSKPLQAAASHQAKSAAQPKSPVALTPALDRTDHSAEERVRAWYQARAAAGFAAAGHAEAASTAPTVAAQATMAPGSAASLTAAVDSSTADDAAAIREGSSIPDTTPTERVPAPFTHGDTLTAPPAAAGGAKSRIWAPAPLAGPVPPALHGPAPAAKAASAAAARPKLDPELADTMAREALDDSDAVGLSDRSSAALVGSTANTKLAQRPTLTVLDEAPGFEVISSALPG